MPILLLSDAAPTLRNPTSTIPFLLFPHYSCFLGSVPSAQAGMYMPCHACFSSFFFLDLVNHLNSCTNRGIPIGEMDMAGEKKVFWEGALRAY
jgi:hypothetical protein